jgi:DNA primase
MSYLKMLEKYDGRVRKDKWYRMLCPFHDDNSPSLDVDITKSGWRCWSCGKTGNYIELISKLERVSETTAMAIVAKYRSNNIGARGRLGRATNVATYLDKGETLERFVPVSGGTEVANYLKTRKVTLKIAKKFDIREGNSLEKGWQNRVVFPIYDIESNLCSIEGRDITEEAYLRYRKWDDSQSGLGIFGINLVPKKHYKKLMFICEGAIDTLSIWQSGYVGLGLSCSDITGIQMRQLQTVTKFPVIILDGIKPGTEDERKEVFKRLNYSFGKKFKNYRIVEIPYFDTDPNDLYKLGKLKKYLRELVNGIKKRKS